MTVTPTIDAGQLAGIRLMRSGLARMVAGVRTAVTAAAVASALVGTERPVSWWWLLPTLAAVTGWTALYAVTAWTRGLRYWLVGMDVILTCLLCLGIGKVVPAPAIPGIVSWVSTIASMAAITAQLAGTPAASVPAGLLIAASMAAGTRLAHSPDNGLHAALIIAAQTVVAALVMAAGMRGEHTAVRAFADLERAQADEAVAMARQEDEQAQLRLVHGGPLTSLTMALDARTRGLSATLRLRAAQACQDLLQLAAPAGTGGGLVQLDERLAQVVMWYQERLSLTAILPPCSVPGDVADAFASAAAEALENAARYAGTGQAQVELRDDNDTVQVGISDQGRGFELARLRPVGYGLRREIPERMAGIGGMATIRSAPGAGTAVELEWHRD